jgi:NCS1 family nucleobase:cation symporter-1
MANTLPESAAINTQQLVGFIIYIAIFVPLMFVHPSKLQPILVVAFIGVAATIIGLFGWAVGSNGGAGTVIASSKIIDQAEGSFRMLQACSAVAGSWTGSSIRQSDWTRFAKTKRSPVLNQLIGAPATITIAAAFGVFATSAVKSASLSGILSNSSNGSLRINTHPLQEPAASLEGVVSFYHN